MLRLLASPHPNPIKKKKNEDINDSAYSFTNWAYSWNVCEMRGINWLSHPFLRSFLSFISVSILTMLSMILVFTQKRHTISSLVYPFRVSHLTVCYWAEETVMCQYCGKNSEKNCICLDWRTFLRDFLVAVMTTCYFNFLLLLCILTSR